jgi:NitT/TauT family transport system ATP-binding protein
MTNVRNADPEADTDVGRNTPGPVLEVEHLAKAYRLDDHRTRPAIGDVSLEVRRGELLCIVGSSGAGKTTLVKCLAGLLAPTEGRVLFEGRPIAGTPAGLGVVFQEYGRSLFPWWTVERNVTLGLRGRRMKRRDQREAAARALRAVALDDVLDAYPWQLSGGMQQRVAIARALACDAELLLMDEPFASVDAQTRYELEDLVVGLNEQQRLTVLLVTHDVDEAVYVADRIAVLDGAPSSIREVVEVGLPHPRNQHDTKGSPEFTRLRTRVMELLSSSRTRRA